MATVRTVDFLPEIFQTSTNKQFLAATLDQLVQEPQFKKTQGYVGRRVGPGVNADDKYVVEPTESRADYQLEPGVVFRKTDSTVIKDAVTYPGITDALGTQGAFVDQSQRLYTSEYYTWDPQINWDKFVNYSQYYWLPGGPLSVDVGGTAVPLTADYTVTRENGVYTFSNYTGSNPTITLLRNGNYTFTVAQNATETVNYRVTAATTSAYIIDYLPNPSLTLVRGNTYVFNLNLGVVSPFWIKTTPSQGRIDQYNTGVSRNGANTGNITFTVPQDAPDTLYYASETQFNMQGVLTIIDGTPGTGPGFWIQTDPGVDGVLPYAPNISSRDVLGVTNNGEDLGTVTFSVPAATAQSFYYGLTSIAPVDLATNLTFSQINNVFLSEFFAEYPSGIDGITNLNGRTLVFLNTTDDVDADSWENITQFDPLVRTAPNQVGATISYDVNGEPYDDLPYNTITDVIVSGTPDQQDGLPGSFDSIPFAQATLLTQAQRYSVWRIEYVTTAGGQIYMQLNSVLPVAELEKFTIAFGTQYSNTNWYKDASGYFEEIPLLTAIKDVLYYQDGTDPGIFGQIRLLDQTNATTTYINDIVGKPNYTSSNGVVFTNGLKVQFRGSTIPAEYENQEYYVEGVGTAIRLLPVSNFVTPEPYTQNEPIPFDSLAFDVGNYDASLSSPLIPEYLTIGRASPDLNAWTRSNRWFHIDIINASAAYNNTTPILSNSQGAKRPIIEFNAGTRLYDFGTQGKLPVNIVDFNITDALSTINGSLGYGIDGYEFVNGTRVIFAADTDPDVRNKVYVVNFIIPDTVPPLIAQPIINLVPADDSTVLIDQTVVTLSGLTTQGTSYYYDGVTWIRAQQKTATNQAPLFNVYDSAGISFSDRSKYPSSTFVGSKLFSYATGQGAADTVLGLPLRYLSINNIGDIVFDNNFYTDQFIYAEQNTSKTVNISEGYSYQYASRVVYERELGWQVAATPSLIRQQFQFTYDGSPLRFNINIPENTVVPPIQLFVANKYILPAEYTVTRTDTTTTIILNNIYTPGSIIEVQVLSTEPSDNGFYQVPINLANNPFNVNSPYFTLGTIRTHYESIARNLIDFAGDINGANNTRDLGNIGRYGTTILEQSAPLTLAGFFMRSSEYNIFKSMEFNDREYTKFKNRLLENAIRGEWGNLTTSEILDSVVTDLNIGKTNVNSFYYSDMLPSGNVYTDTVYTVTPITVGIFDTLQTHSFTSANFLGLLVFLNNTLLTLNYDYTVATDGPTLTVTVPLAVGDVVTVREYADTAGNYVPNTPTKMGLYQAYKPEMFLDENYVNPTVVIRGHDGSITAAFGDMRDDILLEFERRIFNNLKTEGNPVPIPPEEVIPGYFRTTDYTQAEITTILGESFLTWVGQNKLDYKTQQYIANNPFTYNYSQAGDKEKDLPLLGAWRGISRYFYDTLSPNYTPWEMLGFSQQPAWWETRYGPAPYTQDNLVLWDDIQAGIVADPDGYYIKPDFVRPNLSTYFIPTGTEGQLLAPLDSVVGQYNPNAFRKSWVVGDGGPVEAAWWTSSSYPFAVMRLLALTRPAKFFSLFADRDLYKYSTEFEQYLYNGRYRLDASGVQVYGGNVNISTGVVTPVSKASYINWIVDYNQQLGINSTQALEEALANLDVRLCWRTGSFTDKQYLKIYTERSSPNSLNSSLLLPDESYDLMLYKNSPFATVAYSAVIIQSTDTGYAVFGYSTTDPYFDIYASRASGELQTISAGGTTVRVPRQYTNDIVQVPYGFVFTNQSSVVDFLLSYGQYLTTQGLVFDTRENGYTLDWKQMASEFLYWANQGWAVNSLINLNPAALQLTADRPGAVVDSISVQNPENMLLDQNRTPFDARNLVIERLENRFTITGTNNQAISYVKLQFVSYEDIVILNNVSVFADLIYNPPTGARQNRVYVSAITTTEWNGTLNAQGFVLNRDNVKEWAPNIKYAKGEIVLYKNLYWSAQDIIQPKREFAYSDWVKSDYTKIQKGLLPNIANKADQLENSYNTQTANLEGDNDLLSFGLIGFQPREYMVALNLDDVSQVNLYQQFIGAKGTILSAELFTGARLEKESADYQIYENWAVLRGTYGANANRSYVELRLNEPLLQSDPATVQIIQPGESSLANQTVLLNDVWRESYKLTSPDFLPTTTTQITDTALPSAGYVNIDDVDITVFSLDDPGTIAANLDTIGNGTKIWVAKTNSYDWNIYRATQVPGRITRVTDNLDGASLVSFTQVHNLSLGDILIVRFFNDAFNGVYRVLTTPTPTTLTVAYTFPNGNQTVITGSGIGFYLDTMRVAQASDIGTLSFANDLVPGAMAWVDNNGAGLWTVLEKQDVFAAGYALESTDPVLNSGYGTSVAQAYENIAALVGAPLYDSGVGAIYPYLRGQLNLYEASPLIQLGAADTAGYGSALDIGYQSWAIVGAPQSNSGDGYTVILYRAPASNEFLQTQLLIAPDYGNSAGSFGSAVAISRDERWAYIGAPDQDAVYAYGRVDLEIQEVTYIGNSATTTFNYSDNLVFDLAHPGQITVLVNNAIQQYGVDYNLNSTSVIFTTPPLQDLPIVIARNMLSSPDSNTYYDVEQDSTDGSGILAMFTVERIRGTYTPTITSRGAFYADGDTLTIDAATIGGGTSPANDLIITVTAVDGLGAITEFTYSGAGVSNTSVFDLSTTLYTATNLNSFSVRVSDVLQRPYIDYTFAGTTLTFVTLPAAGVKIDVETGSYFMYVETITGPAGSGFGTSVATATDGQQIVIGAPTDNNNGLAYGSTYVYDRSVARYQVGIGETDVTTFTLPAGYNTPVSVTLNNAFLTDADQILGGQFTVSGSTVTLEDTVTLAVGDIIEIASNIFQQVQQITQHPVTVNAGQFIVGQSYTIATVGTTNFIKVGAANNNVGTVFIATGAGSGTGTATDITNAGFVNFGQSVDLCSNNCSIYTGAPTDGTVLPGAGSVQRSVNQSRVYGVISSQIPNPVLTSGDTLRIDNYEIAIPASPNNTVAGLVTAINTANEGVGVPNVRASAAGDLFFVSNGAVKTYDIGVTYSKYATYNPLVYVDNVVQIFNTDYTYNNSTGIISFVTAPTAQSTIRVVQGILTLNVINPAAVLSNTRLTVLPGVVGTVFADFGFVDYVYTQTITSPAPTVDANFGAEVFIDTTATTLVVGAPRGNLYQPVTFDDNTTYFDDRSTVFSTVIVQSGVTYTFDYLPSATDSVTNPGQFVFGQQMYDNNIVELDQYGTAVSYVTGRLLIGSPGSDFGDSSNANYGRVSVFENANRTPAWTVKHVQQPVVDIALLNSVYMYDKLESTITSYLDFIDPLQGKILGVARENIDYIGAVDPANYNIGPIRNVGNPWAAARIGEIWWDTNSVRFIDPNQDDIVYASRRWSQTFPGSSVDIYQWIESDVTPAAYAGPGTPLSVLSYTARSELNTDNIFATRYYFWVRNISTVATAANKKLSTNAIANYIFNPRASGISYLAPLNASTVAIYNVLSLISAQDTILHIEYDRIKNDDNVHQEYELIADGVADSFLSAGLYLKLQDSLSGINTLGSQVPDPSLSPAERYGVEFRPRQSMFVDRFAALKNYFGYANRILANYPISETKSFSLLNSKDTEPTAIQTYYAGTFNTGDTYTISYVGTTDFTAIGAASNTIGVSFVATGPGEGTGTATFVNWNSRVADLTELGYQNLSVVPYGYRYLVATDSSNFGFWTIYDVVTGPLVGSKELRLIRVQNYDTSRYWSYINWYAPGYNSTVNPVATVTNYAELSGITFTVAPVGSSVKVTNAPAGKFEIYQRTLTSWDRVGLEDGTIEFSATLWNYSLGNFGFDVEVFDAQYFDQEPVIETRKIVQAVNQQLFIDELAINRNRSLMLMFEFVMSEFSAPGWLLKTSLIDVNHKIRSLLPYQSYRQDNQDFVLNYIQEVKPYHVQIREFNLQYTGNDEYPGALTDFDNPAFFDETLTVPQFISPVLLPYTQSTANSPTNPNADTASNAEIWTETPWADWYNNYTLTVQSVVITNTGSGYTVVPTITITGDAVIPAEMTAIVNSAGQIVSIDIVNYGSGYITTPIITFVGGNGSGATAAVVMGNDLVRQIKTTMKYDRYQYVSTIQEWQPNVTYEDGTQVRYANRVWQANSDDSFGVQSATFDPTNWTLVSASTLSGVDRTMGFYTPTVNQPGLSLPLLIDGVEYPGVQVFGVGYDQYPGFDVAPFDSTPFDNLTYGPEGRPTFDQTILDTIFESPYTDPYLGTRPTSINIEGGEYIDVFSSYAPEELVPGSEFDTLDMRVYTTPGADWARDGHGFRIEVRKFTVTSAGETLSFAGIATVPATMLVANQTLGLNLIVDVDYTANWAEQTITLNSSVSVGSEIAITLYEIGGGNQLFKQSFNGAEVGSSVVVPVKYSLITQFVIFANGELTTDYTFVPYGTTSTEVVFAVPYTINDYLMIGAIGPTTIDGTEIDYSWSVPVTQYITGVTGVLEYELTNSMEYTNPDNIVVTFNGIRARTSAGIEYLADGTTDYLLPTRLGFSQSFIADNEVRVYVNNIPQVLGVDFVVEPYDPITPRAVMFTETLTLGEKILICVTTNTQVSVVGTQLLFNTYTGMIPSNGDIIAVTSWNDTRQQDILTQVYVGPVTGSALAAEPYDTTDYDIGLVTNESGSYDYSIVQSVTRNDLYLNRTILNPERLWVTLNGLQIFVNDGFTIVDDTIVLASNYIMSATDVVMITEFTDSVAPQAMAFRIFQDMRGVQATYRITPATTTYLVEPLSTTDDIIYVHNAAALNEPNLAANIWGLLTVNGERIMYRNRDIVANTVSGLRRGTAGTGVASHTADTDVYNIGRGNLQPPQFQNYIVSDSIIANGTDTIFYAPNITLTYDSAEGFDFLPYDVGTVTGQPGSYDYGAGDPTNQVEVYVGGIQLISGFSVISTTPVAVLFEVAPPEGVEVTILVRRGVTWYAPGAGTASNGVALQDTETQAARFLRGD